MNKIGDYDYEIKHHLRNQKDDKKESIYESYLEAEHDIVNLKEENNEKNIYFNEILNNLNQSEIPQQELNQEINPQEEPIITQDIYFIRNIDTGEAFDMRIQETEKILDPSRGGIAKLNGVPWADRK